ncbi:hypothetical protein [Naasia sp. SYSU D00948]|nr:hypothetical protein [Naasia sp. SYSU D00948]
MTFASDSHEPWNLAKGLAEVARMAQRHGFVEDRRPELPWRLAS